MIYIGSDHGGFDLKEKLKKWLKNWGYAYEDLGNKIYDKDDDYPRFAITVAKKVAKEEMGKGYPNPWSQRPKGILICRSSVGMSIAANKIKGIRAVSAFSELGVIQSRQHIDSNIIAVGADFLEELEIKKIIKVWLETEYSGEERHTRRIKMIEEIEKIELPN